jgi:hypothetical protein
MGRYLRILALSFAATLLAVAAFTRLIDPYAYWGGPEIAGLNRYKPASVKHLRAVKLRQVERVQPATLLVGNSRVGVGFDPEAAAWPAEARPVYNLGLAGTGTAELVEAAVEAMDRTRPKALVFAADFVDFRVTLRDWRTWNATHAVPAGTGAVREKVEVLLSLAALTDSLGAMAEQHKAYPAHLTRAGFDSLASYNDNVAAEGHAALFEQRHRENIARYLAGPKAVRWPGPGNSASWAALDRLAEECRRRGVALTIVTYPYHVELLLAFERAGLWGAFEDWQRGLAAFSARTGTPVWDFSRVTPEVAEPVPAPGDTRTHMRWYWEAGHFKAALGALVAADLASPQPRLGRRLTREALAAQLAEKRLGLARYRLAGREETERFERLFAQVRAASGPPELIESASR